jgi:hypothetical protein
MMIGNKTSTRGGEMKRIAPTLVGIHEPYKPATNVRSSREGHNPLIAPTDIMATLISIHC